MNSKNLLKRTQRLEWFIKKWINFIWINIFREAAPRSLYLVGVFIQQNKSRNDGMTLFLKLEPSYSTVSGNYISKDNF